MKKKLAVVLSAALMAVTMMTACSSGSTKTTSNSKETGNMLSIGGYVLDTQMANKNPFITTGTYSFMLNFIYEGLFYYNPVSSKIVPALADSYSWSSDNKTLTCKINTKVKWQDGQAFTADDVAFTFQMLKDNPSLDQYGVWQQFDSVTADGNNVEFTCKEPYPSLPNYLSIIDIVPKHIWSSVSKPATYLNDKPIGTGPFVYSKYTTGTDIQLTANKSYWRGAPKVGGIDIKMYNSATNCTLALLKGDVQVTDSTIAMANLPEFKTKTGAKVQVMGGNQNFAVMINNDKPLLNDVNVRKAMVTACNPSDLITKGEYNGVKPLSLGWLPDIFSDVVSTDAKNLQKYDADQAQKILTADGYTKGSDGIFQKNGKRLSFTYYNASGAPAQQMEAGMMQQWLLNAGIEIVPKLATWPQLTKLAQTGEYDLIQNYITFPADPYAALNTCFNSSMTAAIGTATPGLNYFRYRNSEVDSLLKQVSSTTDKTQQKNLYIQIQNKIANDYPFIPMYNLGGHYPYYDGTFTGWDDSAPVISNLSIIKVHKK